MTPRALLCRIVVFYQVFCNPRTLRGAGRFSARSCSEQLCFIKYSAIDALSGGLGGSPRAPVQNSRVLSSILHSTHSQGGWVVPRALLFRTVVFYRLFCHRRTLRGAVWSEQSCFIKYSAIDALSGGLCGSPRAPVQNSRVLSSILQSTHSQGCWVTPRALLCRIVVFY